MYVTMVGHLGADAKATEKGFSFSLPQKNREGNEDKILWVACFQNYMSGVFEHMKKGTFVQVIGELNIGVYNHPEKGLVSSVSCRVLNIDLLPSKSKESKEG